MNSIINKLSLLSDLVVEHSLDLFGVAETWLLPDVPDSFVSLYLSRMMVKYNIWTYKLRIKRCKRRTSGLEMLLMRVSCQ